MPPREVRDAIYLSLAVLLFGWSLYTMWKAGAGVRGLLRPIPLLMIALSAVYVIDHAIYGDLSWRSLVWPLFMLSAASGQARGGGAGRT